MAQAAELTTVEPEAREVAPISESAAILSVIERMALDPNIDPDRIERFIAMRERMEATAAEKAFNAAMNAAQAEMGVVVADGSNPQTRSKYATYARLDKALRPIYTKHGFSLSFDEADSPSPDTVRIICHVSHSAGHTRSYHKDMDKSGKGAKGNDVMTKTHATGAAQSYGMRYLLRGIFNVAVGEEDTDGNMPGDAISGEQLLEIRDLIDRTDTDIERFCAAFKIEALPDLPAKSFYPAKAMLERKLAAKEAAQ